MDKWRGISFRNLLLIGISGVSLIGCNEATSTDGELHRSMLRQQLLQTLRDSLSRQLPENESESSRVPDYFTDRGTDSVETDTGSDDGGNMLQNFPTLPPLPTLEPLPGYAPLPTIRPFHEVMQSFRLFDEEIPLADRLRQPFGGVIANDVKNFIDALAERSTTEDSGDDSTTQESNSGTRNFASTDASTAPVLDFLRDLLNPNGRKTGATTRRLHATGSTCQRGVTLVRQNRNTLTSRANCQLLDLYTTDIAPVRGTCEAEEDDDDDDDDDSYRSQVTRIFNSLTNPQKEWLVNDVTSQLSSDEVNDLLLLRGDALMNRITASLGGNGLENLLRKITDDVGNVWTKVAADLKSLNLLGTRRRTPVPRDVKGVCGCTTANQKLHMLSLVNDYGFESLGARLRNDMDSLHERLFGDNSSFRSSNSQQRSRTVDRGLFKNDPLGILKFGRDLLEWDPLNLKGIFGKLFQEDPLNLKQYFGGNQMTYVAETGRLQETTQSALADLLLGTDLSVSEQEQLRSAQLLFDSFRDQLLGNNWESLHPELKGMLAKLLDGFQQIIITNMNSGGLVLFPKTQSNSRFSSRQQVETRNMCGVIPKVFDGNLYNGNLRQNEYFNGEYLDLAQLFNNGSLFPDTLFNLRHLYHGDPTVLARLGPYIFSPVHFHQLFPNVASIPNVAELLNCICRMLVNGAEENNIGLMQRNTLDRWTNDVRGFVNKVSTGLRDSHLKLRLCPFGQIRVRGMCKKIRPPLFGCGSDLQTVFGNESCEAAVVFEPCDQGFELVGDVCRRRFPPIHECPFGTRVTNAQCRPILHTNAVAEQLRLNTAEIAVYEACPASLQYAAMLAVDCPQNFFRHSDGSCLPLTSDEIRAIGGGSTFTEAITSSRRTVAEATCAPGYIPASQVASAYGNRSSSTGTWNSSNSCFRPSRRVASCREGWRSVQRVADVQSQSSRAVRESTAVCRRIHTADPVLSVCRAGLVRSADGTRCTGRVTTTRQRSCPGGSVLRDGHICERVRTTGPSIRCRPNYIVKYREDGSRFCEPVFQLRLLERKLFAEMNPDVVPEITCPDGFKPMEGGEVCVGITETEAEVGVCPGEVDADGTCYELVEEAPTFICNDADGEVTECLADAVMVVPTSCPEGTEDICFDDGVCLGMCFEKIAAFADDEVDIEVTPDETTRRLQSSSRRTTAFCPSGSTLQTSRMSGHMCEVRVPAKVSTLCNVPHVCGSAGGERFCPTGYSLNTFSCIED